MKEGKKEKLLDDTKEIKEDGRKVMENKFLNGKEGRKEGRKRDTKKKGRKLIGKKN